MKKIIEKTRQISKQFPQKYDTRDHFIDLVEEVGELAQALMISTGRKRTNDPAKQRDIEDVKDALCDVLFELIRLSDDLGIDLEAEYVKTLEQIQERIDKGEFSTEEHG